MIITFVEYPHARADLVLEAFYKMFGIPWYEADISDQTDFDVTAENKARGCRSAGEAWRVFFDKHCNSKNSLIFIRTYRVPSEDLPFVYILRNPASVFMDIAKMPLADTGQDLSDILLRQMLGSGEHPDWSAHYLAWKQHKERVFGYFLRLEDFCADPLRSLVKIAVRLHLPKPQKFEEYHCDLPADRLEEFEGVDRATKSLLYALHGEVMAEMGYQQPGILPAEKPFEDVPMEILARAIIQLREESNQSKMQANKVHAMASYIASLENQYKQETENLIARIKKLSGTL